MTIKSAARGSKTVAKKKSSKPVVDFGIMTSKVFDQKKYKRSWLVESLLVDQELAVIAGGKKTLKTHLALDLAISLATATPFLDHFDVPAPKRAMVFSGELSPASLRDAAHRICESKNVPLCDCDVLWAENFIRLGSAANRNALRRSIQRNHIDVVIIDPLYLAGLVSNPLETNILFAMGSALQKAAEACLDAGATPLFVHHTTKGANKLRATKEGKPILCNEPADLDDFAGSGTPECCRQWITIKRRLQYTPGTGFHRLLMSVGGSSGQSGSWYLDINEGQLQRDFSGRYWEVGVSDWSDEPEDAQTND